MTPPDLPPILAIETSCDDTAAAVWADGRLASSVVAGQRVHEGFGGVVPEHASRAHERLIVPTIEAALAEAGLGMADLGAVAVTVGPGLAGSLLVGLSAAKGIALGRGLPLLGVNHLEGHVYSVMIEEPRPSLPFLCLTVSGGHTLLTLVREGFAHEELGRTRDDAAGEAFDKVAKLLGLPYPGGPHIDRLAAEGDAAFLDLPSPRLGPKGRRGDALFDLSFSGIKTAVRYWIADLPEADRVGIVERHRADVAASFQRVVVESLVEGVRQAVEETGVRAVAVVGGVSANSGLRRAVTEAGAADGFDVFVPDLQHSVDNAAMIAVTAAYKWAAGETSDLSVGATPSLAL
ncbi:tRNA (adenosine(37)-N6)-threonylcarbamoyltransferase complex transferase subunit TsaD [Rubrivirga marina]|uniref:tRNA N6-adenosine threonylcarbamoyltransferase n=1 Tax=Rubrivirga marina TaxID=1196024 RepID=A0A271IVR6_9BACT|nr:tRNA (adenosine(37)-N6)-threonylcarbamoyltransferase complex transferase subunit TsaD [Rubrivirga marina]PAP75217.1 tRNA (adenosine(37)-N6)-threonylcarbamoyltransferase complex transferase subunit TsaD [Rubrivirga marina]